MSGRTLVRQCVPRIQGHILKGLIVQEVLAALEGRSGVLNGSQREVPCVGTDRNLIISGRRLSACGLLRAVCRWPGRCLWQCSLEDAALPTGFLVSWLKVWGFFEGSPEPL